jgi:hypothetical protein
MASTHVTSGVARYVTTEPLGPTYATPGVGRICAGR